MNMSTWAIRKPVPSLALFLVLVIVGLVSFRQLPVTQFPNIDIPIVTVSGTSPAPRRPRSPPRSSSRSRPRSPT